MHRVGDGVGDGDAEGFAALVRARRTSMVVDHDRSVPRDVVEWLCDLATWAPNHKRTWPWQFALVEGEGRTRLGEVISRAIERHGDGPDKVAAARTKYLRTPSVLVVAARPGDTPLRTAENRDAVAAAVQTILLAATARGLASYWASCPRGANDDVAAWCGFAPDSHITALVYLGWAAGTVGAPDRPAADLRIIDR